MNWSLHSRQSANVNNNKGEAANCGGQPVPKGENMKKSIATLAWIIGICLAGSEGPIYINFVGLTLFCFSSLAIFKEVSNG